MDRDIICGVLGRSKIKFKYDGKDTIIVENKVVMDVKLLFDTSGQLARIEAFEDEEA